MIRASNMHQPDCIRHLTVVQPVKDYNYTPLPEKMLCMAVLQRAILDYLELSMSSEQGKNRKEDRVYYRGTAVRWFLDDECDPFSFCWVCEHLDIDTDFIRRFLYVAKKSDSRYFKTGFECWYDFFTTDESIDTNLLYLASKK